MRIERGISVFGLFLVVLVIAMVIVPSVFAFDMRYQMDSVIRGIQDIGAPIFSALFGMYQSDEFLFVKILLFILLFVVIKTAIRNVPAIGEKNSVTNIVALVVSLFAVRYISDNDLTRSILLPYGVLGVALTVILPFLIYFFFVHKSIESGTGRKAAWIFYLIVLFVIWMNRRETIGDIGNDIYVGIMALSLLLMFFDNKVKEYFERSESKEAAESMRAERIAEAMLKYRTYANAYVGGGGVDKYAQRTANRYAKLLRKYGVDAKDV